MGVGLGPWFLSCADGPTDPGAQPPPVVPVPTTVAVKSPLASLSSLGETAQLAAQVLDQNGNAMAGVTVTWSSSASDVATVSGAGLVTSTGNGEATITALAGTASGTAAARVRQLPAVTEVAPKSVTLELADTVRLTATVTDVNGKLIAGAEVAWASADSGVATVSADGLVTAVSAGSTTVTATAGDADAEAVVVVGLRADSIAVSPAALLFETLGDTRTADGNSDGRQRTPHDEAVVTWSTADPSVATVDEAGLVTASGAGVTRVTTTHDSLASSADVEVTAGLSEDRERHGILLRRGGQRERVRARQGPRCWCCGAAS